MKARNVTFPLLDKRKKIIFKCIGWEYGGV
jgi:hypothetical protein